MKILKNPIVITAAGTVAALAAWELWVKPEIEKYKAKG
jgi:hypothetical protein